MISSEFYYEIQPISKRYHLVYQTTNLVNGNIYIGVHSTDDLDDGYIGSGLLISRAVKKHGRHAFSRKILSFHYTIEGALAEERRLVDQEFVDRKDTYNATIGGGYPPRQSWLGKSHTEETKRKIGLFSSQRVHTDETKEKISESLKNRVYDTEARMEKFKKTQAKKNPLNKPENIEHLKRMSEDSMTLSQMKEFFDDIGVDVSMSTIARCCRKYGLIRFRELRHNPEWMALVFSMKESGMSSQKISDELARRGIVNRYGNPFDQSAISGAIYYNVNKESQMVTS